MNLKKVVLLLAISSVLVLSACGTDDDTANGDDFNYSEELDYTIIGIEPGAGITATTETAIDQEGGYESLAGWDLEQSSTVAMVTELESAIANEEPIIVTGWNPHWKFAQFPDLKYLDDPKGIYGGAENIQTLARLGFEEEHPEAYEIIDRFYWDVEDMEEIMYESNETGDDIHDVAQQWVEENEGKVSEWTEGVAEGDGSVIEIVSTPWDTERSSSSVLSIVLEEHGFDVDVTPVDPAIVFESLATGDADATVAAWLPFTHAGFYESVEDDIVDLGPNLEGAKIGLVVPGYMDIDSIEDLEPAE
ncbi:glycine betaine/proline transport system substrate-binding protein [Alkalibacillus filiformis]|uniref:Glycine betaine/proline transport system substrate-binding protein n=1 Tax=Alkalibacillus filiformis TaxID=200990 RepID=A0ABU0DTA2_9BACI|nr:glycine betaine ABC transporter substrate-binding protein [Alkalibacillus filiformis]MDQ0351674.1 glycine betaine/proline transport system substrate-binding protein [Alkalibacillus filiformis]